MSSNLFAFQLSRPLEHSREAMGGEYDPQTQTILLWQGGTSAQAQIYECYCTKARNFLPYCNAYGPYCTTWGEFNPCDPNGFKCDCG